VTALSLYPYADVCLAFAVKLVQAFARVILEAMILALTISAENPRVC
jgi:hypothetical protein